MFLNYPATYWLHGVFRSSVNVLGLGFLLRAVPFHISLLITSTKLKLKGKKRSVELLGSGALKQLVKILHQVSGKI